MALFTNDLLVIKNMFGFGFIMLVDAVFLGGLSVAKMFAKNWVMTLFALIPMSLIAISAIYVGRIMEKKFKDRQEAYEELSDFTQENFSGISVIKAFVKHVVEVLHFEKINKKNYDKNINYIRFSMLLSVLLGLIIALIMTVLIGGGAYFSIYGFNGQEFTSGDVWEFVLLFNSTIWPFMAVSELINSLAQANASLERVTEFLDTKVEIEDNNVIDVEEIKEHLLEIDGVEDVHHVHVWSMDGYHNCATMHIVTDTTGNEIKEKIRKELKKYKVGHATLELETSEEKCNEQECYVEHKKHCCHHHHHNH
jgi:ATP-binding cassette subfamily B protein